APYTPSLHDALPICHNAVRTRNARLAAIHTFMRYVAQQEPTALALASRVLAIPNKRFHRPLLGFLSPQETETILQAPDPSTENRSEEHTSELQSLAY